MTSVFLSLITPAIQKRPCRRSPERRQRKWDMVLVLVIMGSYMP